MQHNGVRIEFAVFFLFIRSNRRGKEFVRALLASIDNFEYVHWTREQKKKNGISFKQNDTLWNGARQRKKKYALGQYEKYEYLSTPDASHAAYITMCHTRRL